MSIKKIRILFICLASSFMALPVTAIAGAESGLYVGFGAGDTSLEANDGSFDLEDSGYKILGGYNIGIIPLVDFAVEASYVDFGEFVVPGDAFEVTGVSAFGLVGTSFGPIGVFAKAGVLSWEAEQASSGSTDDGTDSAYGVGARFAIGSFAVRAEYEVFELEDIDLDMVSISGVYTF